MPESPSLDPRPTVDHVPAPQASSTVADTGPYHPAGSTEPYLPALPADAPSISGYHITAEIARGGMGRVYAGLDRTLDREVAVKTLLPGANAERFVTEAKITARLPHPGIPPVYALGTLADGTPYLAMKLIRGRTLAELLEQRSTPLDELSRFVQIFEQIAQAVGFAHAQGILHRDLKPQNVMVGAFGEVQVMDWGLAKDTAGDERERAEELPGEQNITHTTAGAVLGTPGYMAPEQARGEVVDPRADVFALGATLATILTGRPAFVGTTVRETIQKAARAELAGVRERLTRSGADGELIALALLCLSAKAAERPVDGRAVAAEVAAYRAGVETRLKQAETERTEALVREAEQRKRRRIVQVAGVVVAIVLLAGLSASLWQMFRAIDAEGQANQNAKQARNERDVKDFALTGERLARQDEAKARQQAFEALQSLTTDVIEKKFAQGAVLTDADRAFLRGIITQFDAFAAIKGADADSRSMRAVARLKVGNIRFRLGEMKEAEKDYDQALRLQKQLAADFPSQTEYRRTVAGSHINRGVLLRATSRLPEAAQEYDQALRIQKQLAADFPSRPEFREDLSMSYNNRGYLLYNLGRLPEAEQEFTLALGLRKQLVADFPTRPGYRQELALCHNNRANVLCVLGRHPESEKDYAQAVTLYKQLAAEFPTRPEYRQELARSYCNRGILLRDRGRLPEAKTDYDAALSLQNQLAAEFPTGPESRWELASGHNNRGNLLQTMGRLPEAEKDFDRALTIYQQLATEFSNQPQFRQELATSRRNRGNMLFGTGRLEEAKKDYDEALRLYKKLVAEFPNQPDSRNGLAGTCVTLAMAHFQQGDWVAAQRLLQEGRPHHLAALKASPGNQIYRRYYGEHLRVLAAVHARQLKPEDAVHTAETRRDLGWSAPADAYEAACCLSKCIAIMAQHDKLDAAKRKEATQFYGDATMKLLREAVRKGYQDVSHMKKDTDLDPLRPRQDFQKLVAELEGKGK